MNLMIGAVTAALLILVIGLSGAENWLDKLPPNASNKKTLSVVRSQPAQTAPDVKSTDGLVTSNTPFLVQGSHVFSRDCEGILESCRYSRLPSADADSRAPFS